jgi:hypothetical protein
MASSFKFGVVFLLELHKTAPLHLIENHLADRHLVEKMNSRLWEQSGGDRMPGL